MRPLLEHKLDHMASDRFWSVEDLAPLNIQRKLFELREADSAEPVGDRPGGKA